MRDFFEVLKNLGLYNRTNHNKTENIYYFDNGSSVEFFSADDDQKLRGRKRDIAWLNESNELFLDDFTQINLRTTHTILCDYNPSASSSWLYELPEEDTILIKTTYHDNPFLEERIIKQIEGLKNTDMGQYTIFALGERAITTENVYNHFQQVDEKPERFDKYVVGVDFGFNHPTAVVKVWYFENQIYIEPVIYESNLTSALLIQRLEEKGIGKDVEMVCDSSRPEMIQEMVNAGYQAFGANKNAGSVMRGINGIKMTHVYYHKDDKATKEEYENYKWVKKNGKITDEVIKEWDDILDGVRYAFAWIKDYYTSQYYLF